MSSEEITILDLLNNCKDYIFDKYIVKKYNLSDAKVRKPRSTAAKVMNALFTPANVGKTQRDIAKTADVKPPNFNKNIRMIESGVNLFFKSNNIPLEVRFVFLDKEKNKPSLYHLTCKKREGDLLSTLECQELHHILKEAAIELIKEGIIKRKHLIEDLLFFQNMEEILNPLYMSEEQKTAEWFRDIGPIATDFDYRVYRRVSLLEDLQEVTTNDISILEGEAAAGKTVLIRHFAYDRLPPITEKTEGIYYYRCDPVDPLDPKLLAKEADTLFGIIIIDDIHLRTREIQLFMDKYEPSPGRQLLLSGRSQFRRNADPLLYDFKHLPSIELKPFDDVDEIIEYYRYIQKLEWSDDVKEKLRNVSGGDLWLLSLALKGCERAAAGGDEISWIETGVRIKLSALRESIPYRPYVLVALSPLYMDEMATHENYLTSPQGFGFDIETLTKLVSMGEIIRYEEEDSTLYGLTHSSVATAYWKYGQHFWKGGRFNTRERHIYEYVTSGVSNGVEVLINLDDTEMATKILDQLIVNGHMENVFDHENSFMAICEWMAYTYSRKRGTPINVHALELIPPENIKDFLNQRLFQFYISDELSNIIFKKMIKCKDLSLIKQCITTLCSVNPIIVEEYLSNDDKKTLALILSKYDNIYELNKFMRDTLSHSSRLARELCLSLDTEMLARTVNNSKNNYAKGSIIDAYNLVCTISNIVDTKGTELWNLVKGEALHSSLMSYAKLYDVSIIVRNAYHTNNNIGNELWGLLCESRHYLRKLESLWSIKEASACIRVIFEASIDRGWELWDKIDGNRYVAQLNESKDIYNILDSLHELYQANVELGGRVFSKLNGDYLRDSLNRKKDKAFVFLHRRLNDIIKLGGSELSCFFRADKLADIINNHEITSEDQSLTREMLSLVHLLDERLCDKLFPTLNPLKLSELLLSRLSLCNSIAIQTVELYEKYRKDKRELLSQLIKSGWVDCSIKGLAPRQYDEALISIQCIDAIKVGYPELYDSFDNDLQNNYDAFLEYSRITEGLSEA